MSEQYLVSARKYRPQTFDTVVGQGHITTTLKNAIRHNQLAHAFLFCGPRGVGKTSCARILAKTINCEHPTEDMEACGTCPSCVGFANNTLFNIFELDAASNNSVEDIRELTAQVRFAPQQGKYKVYIIDEVHMLSSAAFNAFLKTLEEPPPYAIFILATTEKHKILPTILSRCQIFDFKRITTIHITEHLKDIAAREGMRAEEAALHVIALKSEGCMRDALSMIDRISGFTDGNITYSGTMEHLNLLDADFYFGLTDCLLSQDVSGSLLRLDDALGRGFDGDTIVDGLAEHFRNLLLCKDARMAKLLDIPNDHKKLFYEKANQAPPSFIISGLGLINQCELEFKNASNKRLHVEICLIRLCYVLQMSKNTGSQEADGLKKKPDTLTIPAAATSVPPPPVATNSASAMPATYQAPVVQVPPVLAEPPQVRVPTTIAGDAPKELPLPAAPAPARKFSKNLLKDISEAVNLAGLNTDQATRTLTTEDVNSVFDAYKVMLQQSGQSINHAQFNLMRVELLLPDEVRFIAPTDFTENYAKAERNNLIAYFKEKINFDIRITTMVVADANHDANQPKILTRTEIYEAMARENPNLAKLKDSLNLQIEY